MAEMIEKNLIAGRELAVDLVGCEWRHRS
jgi:hypothetical protein